jgi:DNA-binding GntR family transcriptional regulator
MSKRRRAAGGEPKLSDLAYGRIKRDVVECVLHPGSAVTETQLTRRYHLGKAPVRAALVRLRQEGLVQPVARRGYVISPIVVKDVQDLFEFRLLLEPRTARLAAGRISDQDIRHLKALCRADKGTGTAFNRANTDFHVVVARAAGNQRVAIALEHSLEAMERLFQMEMTSADQNKAVQDHNLLLQALASGDGDRAEKIAAAHIENARNRVMSAIFSSADMMAVEIRYHRNSGASGNGASVDRPRRPSASRDTSRRPPPRGD